MLTITITITITITLFPTTTTTTNNPHVALVPACTPSLQSLGGGGDLELTPPRQWVLLLLFLLLLLVHSPATAPTMRTR